MKHIVIYLLLVMLFGCGQSIDKLKKTEEIVKAFDKKKEGNFFINATIGSDKSELNVTLDHDLFLAYYSDALYEIILDLHKNGIQYDHYTIKAPNKGIVWEVDDEEIPEITKNINLSKQLMRLLDKKEYVEFLNHSNLKSLGISDTAFLETIEKNPVYPNTEYKGFSILDKEVNGVTRQFMFVFFLNDEKKQNMLVLDPKDQLVYGLEY